MGKITVLEVPKVEKIGVYAIHNLISDKYYIGSSTNVYERMRTHKRNIKRRYYNSKIEADVESNKENIFEFLVLETFPNNKIKEITLRRKETEYIEKYNSIEKGYNIYTSWCNGQYDKNEKLVCKVHGVQKEKIKNEKYKDRIQVNLPKGTRDLIKELTGLSGNAYISKLVLEDLEKRKNKIE